MVFSFSGKWNMARYLISYLLESPISGDFRRRCKNARSVTKRYCMSSVGNLYGDFHVLSGELFETKRSYLGGFEFFYSMLAHLKHWAKQRDNAAQRCPILPSWNALEAANNCIIRVNFSNSIVATEHVGYELAIYFHSLKRSYLVPDVADTGSWQKFSKSGSGMNPALFSSRALYRTNVVKLYRSYTG